MQRVIIDGKTSSWSLVLQGVPQGSLLGPLLFSIYTNKPSDVSTSSINMYAEDTALYASDVDTTVASKRVTDDLSSTHKWCKDNSLEVHQSKTYAMFLSRNKSKRTRERKQATVLFNGSPFQTVSEFRYLRVLLDDGLSFKKHIKSLTSREWANRLPPIDFTNIHIKPSEKQTPQDGPVRYQTCKLPPRMDKCHPY